MQCSIVMSSMFAVRIDYSVSLYGLVSFNKKNNNNFKTVFMVLTKLNGGLSRLHSADEDAVSWLTNYGK